MAILEIGQFWRFFGDFWTKIGFMGRFWTLENNFKLFLLKKSGDFLAIFNSNGKNRQWRQKFGKLAIFDKKLLATLSNIWISIMFVLYFTWKISILCNNYYKTFLVVFVTQNWNFSFEVTFEFLKMFFALYMKNINFV